MATDNRLGELLVREKLISLTQLRQAQDEQKKSNTTLSYALAKMGIISDRDITDFLSQQYRVETINLAEFDIDEDVVKLVPKDVCQRHGLIPVSRAGSSLIVAMSDPSNLHAVDDIKFLTGYNVEPVVAPSTAIEKAIQRYYTAPEKNEDVDYDSIMEGFDENQIDFDSIEAEESS